MPLIGVQVVDGVFSEPETKRVATTLVNVTAPIEGEKTRSFMGVVLEALEGEDRTADEESLPAGKVARVGS
jgi:hypothetical protein